MTFLELCKMVARESGTITGDYPVTVIGQTGRLLKIVKWVEQAWEEIQNKRNAWKFLTGTFEGETVDGLAYYAADDFGLDRLAAWPRDGMTIYDDAIGTDDEGPLTYIEWADYREMYDRGTAVEEKPVHYSISPDNELYFGPVPDGAYIVRGEYRKAPQVLGNDDDEPDMPERFHRAIAWAALVYLAEHDESNTHLMTYGRRYGVLMGNLERDQLPMITIGPALA